MGEGWYHLVAGSCNSSSKVFFCSSSLFLLSSEPMMVLRVAEDPIHR